MAKKVVASFVLDETGSMSAVKEQTIEGFNEYIKTLRSDENGKSIRFTLTKFNSTKREIVYDGARLSKVELLTDETYQPTSATPLYDAIGITTRAVEKQLKKKDRALVIIQTDGLENDSREYSREDIFDLIREKTDAGWTFVFLGADQDAYGVGTSMGVLGSNTLSYASADTSKTFQRAARGTVAYASTGGELTEDFWEDTEEE